MLRCHPAERNNKWQRKLFHRQQRKLESTAKEVFYRIVPFQP